MTAILGISALYHDSAAALLIDGAIVAAAQEERFSREKHDAGMPTHAVRYCLEAAGLAPADLDYVGFYEKPLRTFERLLETYLAYAPRGFASFREAMPLWLNQKLHVRRELDRCLGSAARTRYVFPDHHQSHAAAAFFPSPFEEAAILTLDGVGEWATGSYGVGRGNRIELTRQMRFPHSLGLLYSAFTYHAGFKVNADEYKLMGLAPYGRPRYVDTILERLIDLKQDGSFRMDMSYFNYCEGLTMTSPKFSELFGGPPRVIDAPITEREMDLAASVQVVTEEILLRCARHLHEETGMKNLCLAGGVALNCVANGRVLREGPFDRLWIQPAAGDAGGALGVALFISHQLLGMPRQPARSDAQCGSRLGPSYDDAEIAATLERLGARFRRIDDDGEICDEVAGLLAERQVVGWFQGRMEFGPRALGSRSILGDPRDPGMQSTINRKVKFREGFRPFAPAVLRERVDDYFDVGGDGESPYMLLVGPVKQERRRAVPPDEQAYSGLDKLRVERSEIPAVTHVDFSARVQTVDAQRDGLFLKLLEAFHRKTGCPVLVNTSFNLGWDPIVCSPEEAYRTFMTSRIDALCMGHFLVEKRAQPAWIPQRLDGSAADAFSDLWQSPCCQTSLDAREAGLACVGCGRVFPTENGIHRMFWPHEGVDRDGDVTEMVKAFYEETPFPNYDEHDSLRSLIEKSRQGVYARKLDESIPFNTTVLEVGCGTGQLANFLGISCRRVVATDMCWNSLSLGEAFRRQHELSQVRFVQMNLFRPSLRPASFDVVVCNGVLHHTADPFGGFEKLVPLLRPGGHFVLGLYNRYGRLVTDLRRIAFRLSGGRGRWLDPRLRGRSSQDKTRAWFEDQYRHPHESKHTTGEVLRWFERCGLDFVRAIPATHVGSDALSTDDLFRPAPLAAPPERFLAEVGQVFTGSREGGFFLMIGRKRSAAGAQQTAPRSDC